MPLPSTTEKCVVCGFSSSETPAPTFDDGVAALRSTSPLR
jgi:hypothetical protein